jgi:DNA-binding NarL/FixJ family response regulator
LVVEDMASVGDWLERFFRNYQPVVRAASVLDALRVLGSSTLLAGAVIDIGLPDGSGLDVLVAFRAREPDRPALILTGDNSPKVINTVQRLGCEYAIKPAEIANLHAFQDRVHLRENGRVDLNARIRAFVLQYSLTAAEGAVLALAVRRCPRGDFASQLGIAENTVKTHIRKILAKTGAADIREIAQRAKE